MNKFILSFIIVNSFLFGGISTVFGQELNVTGIIKGADGMPLPGANIIEKGTKNGVQTDIDGQFTIDLIDRNATIVISFIGFTTQEIHVNGQETLDITLENADTALEDVLIVGYGSVKKSDLTGAVSQVSSKEVNAFPSGSVMQSLQGRAAGVQVSQNTGAPGAGFSVRIRGSNSIQGNNDPLYVIDGFPFSGSPTNLNNSDIESIEVLKDASATAIYGSRGANGVVLITTKKGRDGATKVEIESSYSIQQRSSKLDLLMVPNMRIL